MGRIRTIKPEFHSHEELSALPPETHLLAGALTNYADDEGYFNANPGLVKAGTHPLRSDKTSTKGQLEQLAAMGYIEIRSCADGKAIGKIVNFVTHQRVSHPSESRLKDRFRESSGKTPEKLRNVPDDLRPEQGTGNGIEGEQGTGNGEASTPPSAEIPADPIFISMPLLKGKVHNITESNIRTYEQTYPAVAVRQELRKVVAWLDAHKDKCSTSVAGSKQRIVRWLTREQDKGGTRTANPTGGNTHGKPTIAEQVIDASQQALDILRSKQLVDGEDRLGEHPQARGASAEPKRIGDAGGVVLEASR